MEAHSPLIRLGATEVRRRRVIVIHEDPGHGCTRKVDGKVPKTAGQQTFLLPSAKSRCPGRPETRFRYDLGRRDDPRPLGRWTDRCGPSRTLTTEYAASAAGSHRRRAIGARYDRAEAPAASGRRTAHTGTHMTLGELADEWGPSECELQAAPSPGKISAEREGVGGESCGSKWRIGWKRSTR